MQLLLLIYIYTHVVYPNTKQAFNKELLNRHPLKHFSPQSLASIPVVSVQLAEAIKQPFPYFVTLPFWCVSIT